MRPRHLVALVLVPVVVAATSCDDDPKEKSAKPGSTTTTTALVGAIPGEDGATTTTTPKGGGKSGNEKACQTDGTKIPDGHWSGPITVQVDATPHSGGMIKLESGSGSADMVIEKGVVKSGTWNLSVKETGTVEMKGGKGTLSDGSGQMTGTVSGPAEKPILSGNGVLKGTVKVEVSGMSMDAPLDMSVPVTLAMSSAEIDCGEVAGTFLPEFQAKTSGVMNVSGVAVWSGKPV